MQRIAVAGFLLAALVAGQEPHRTRLARLLPDSGPTPSIEGLRLRVENLADTRRAGACAVVSVPLARAAGVTDLARFAVCNERGEPLPTQWKVISRWDGDRSAASRPIRFALAEFPAEVNSR